MTGRTYRMLLAANTRLVEDVSQDIQAAGSLGERKYIHYGLRLLGDVTDDTTHLVHTFYEGERGLRKRLGAAEEKGRHWQSGSPAEILENMYLVVSYYKALIEALRTNAELMDELQARDLDRKRIQFLREMALRIQTGKMAILQKDPAFWTEAMEKDFKEALDYRLSG